MEEEQCAEPKPYISCIKIHGCPILPPLLDDACRQEMREYREKAVAIEMRLALQRQQQRELQKRKSSSDSGIAVMSVLSHKSENVCHNLQGHHMKSSKLGDADDSLPEYSFQQSLILDYLSALSSQESSVCSDYTTPKNRFSSSVDQQTNHEQQASIEQQISFSLEQSSSEEKPPQTSSCHSRDLTRSELDFSLIGNVNAENSLTFTCSVVNLESASPTMSRSNDVIAIHPIDTTSQIVELENVEGMNVTPAHERSPCSANLTSSTDLNPYMDNTVISSVESPTQESRHQDIEGVEIADLQETSGDDVCPRMLSCDIVSSDQLAVSRFSEHFPSNSRKQNQNERADTNSSQLTLTLVSYLSTCVPDRDEVLDSENENPIESSQISNQPVHFLSNSGDEHKSTNKKVSISTPHQSGQLLCNIFNLGSSHKEIAEINEPADKSCITSTSAVSSSHLLPRAYNLVPPNVSLRPSTTITDWLMSSSHISPSDSSNLEDSQGGSCEQIWQYPASTSYTGEVAEIVRKHVDNLESDLDLEPSKLVESTASMQSQENLDAPVLPVFKISTEHCLESSVTPLNASKNVGGLTCVNKELKQDCIVLVNETADPKIVHKSDKTPSDKFQFKTDDDIPPLIRQHSFTVQTGPSSLLRNFVEENGMELNTGTFENPRQIKTVNKSDVTSRSLDKLSQAHDNTSRKEWDLTRAKAMWLSADKVQTFAKPKMPTLKLRNQAGCKQHTSSVFVISSTSSLPNSTVNSPERTRQACGSVDGLNCNIQTPHKRPRRSLNFAESSTRSVIKHSDYSRKNRVGLSSQVKKTSLPMTTQINKQNALKRSDSNQVSVIKNRAPTSSKVIGKQLTPHSSLTKVPALSQDQSLQTKQPQLSLNTKECHKQNKDISQLLSHLKEEHEKQMALLLEKQRVEQEKIQEIFLIQQRRLMEEMQHSCPEAFGTIDTLLQTQPVLQKESNTIQQDSLRDREASCQHETPLRVGTEMYKSHSNIDICVTKETTKFLQENVDSQNESLRRARRQNNCLSKENLASFLSVENLCGNDSNKENVHQLKSQQYLYEDLTIQSIALNQSLPHLIISDSDLEIMPYNSDFDISNIDDQLAKSIDSSTHISKVISTLSEDINIVALDNAQLNEHSNGLNVPLMSDTTLERNLQNSRNSSRSLESHSIHRSYDTLFNSSCENSNLSICVPSHNGSDICDMNRSVLGRVRHSPRCTSRSSEQGDKSPLSSSRSETRSGIRVYDTLHPNVYLPPGLDYRHYRKPTKEEKMAASKIVAAAKGYLLRRLLKTEVVKNMISTIEETLKTALELHEEIKHLGDNLIPQADLNLRERLNNQLEAECQSLYSLVMCSTVEHRLAVIAADRERIKSQSMRPPSGQRPLSSATQRSLKRKQELTKIGPSPVTRPLSSRRASRRPLWEKSPSTRRACSVQSTPSWVVNPRPLSAKPPPRKPWR